MLRIWDVMRVVSLLLMIIVNNNKGMNHDDLVVKNAMKEFQSRVEGLLYAKTSAAIILSSTCIIQSCLPASDPFCLLD